MCGLYGLLSSSLTLHEQSIYDALAYLSVFRGVDSTGAIVLKKEKNNYDPVVLKAVENAVTFVNSSLFTTGVPHYGVAAMLGHSRAATVGAVSLSNAHPFSVGNVVGMHNGTINILKSPDKTDSEQLYEILVDKGFDEMIKFATTGAYALVWYDKDTKTINFTRNKDRTLFYMRGTANLFVYASEYRMLAYIKSLYSQFTDAKIEPFEEYKHYYIEAGGTVLKIKDIRKEAPKKEVAKKSESPFVGCQSFLPTTYPYAAPRSEFPKRQESSKKSEIRSSTRELLFKRFNYVGWNRKCITPERADKLLKDSPCAGCDGTFEINDRVVWVSEKDYVCDTCSKDKQIMSLFFHQYPSFLVKKDVSVATDGDSNDNN